MRRWSRTLWPICVFVLLIIYPLHSGRLLYRYLHLFFSPSLNLSFYPLPILRICTIKVSIPETLPFQTLLTLSLPSNLACCHTFMAVPLAFSVAGATHLGCLCATGPILSLWLIT